MLLALTAGSACPVDDAVWAVDRHRELYDVRRVTVDAPHLLGPLRETWPDVALDVVSPGSVAVVLHGGDGLRARAMAARVVEVARGARPWWGMLTG